MAERLRYAGFAEETDYNPETPPPAAFHIDIASATLDPPTGATLVYGGGRGRAPRVTRPGFYAPAGNLAYAIDVNTVGWMLKWVLGGYEFTVDGGTGGHNLHEIWGNNDVLLPSFTARLGKDVFEHVFRGVVANSLQLSIDDEFAMLTLDTMAARDSHAAIQAVGDLALPDGFPLAFHDFHLSLAGDDKSPRVKSMTLEVNNNQDAEAGRGFGSRHPYRIIAGERSIEIQLSLFYDSMEELQRFWGASNGPSAEAQEEFALTLSAQSGTYGELEMHFPRCVYSEIQTQPDGRDELVQEVTVVAYQGEATLDDESTIETDVLVSLSNSQSEMSA